MIGKSLAMKVLNAALRTGGDYAEIYLEQTDSESVSLENGKVDSCGSNQSFGCGIRILKGFNSVYGYTSDLSQKSLLDLANALADRFEGERIIQVHQIKKERVRIINPIKQHYSEVPTEKKIALLKECHDIIQSVDPRIVRIINSFVANYRQIEIFNAEGGIGRHFVNSEERGRMAMVAVAMGQPGQIETSFSGPGKYADFSYFTDELDYKAEARKVGEKAIAALSAKECPSGQYPVVITNGWGGVLFHEACGHPLEASATSKHLSIFADKIGQQIASPLVSAYDDGTIPNSWGSNNIDSEGVPTHKTQLIKKGICVNYMVDKLNGRRLGMPENGTSRRQSYKYEPTSRMSNTYIAAGKDNPEDIIKDTKLGIYVANFGGGSVEPTTGDFNFSASEAYVIRDGKIAEMLKGCTLIGNGRDVLMNIDRVGNDVDLGVGMCGAASGSIPVCVGQPTIRLKTITVGGRGGKLE